MKKKLEMWVLQPVPGDKQLGFGGLPPDMASNRSGSESESIAGRPGTACPSDVAIVLSGFMRVLAFFFNKLGTHWVLTLSCLRAL